MLKIASRNVNWLRAILKKWNLIDYLKQYKPDIIWLQEIKLSAHQVDKGFLKILKDLGYNYIFFNHAQRPWYAGTAIFSKVKPVNFHKWLFKLTNDDIQKIKNELKLKVSDDEIKKVILNDEEWRVSILEGDNFYFISCYVPNAKVDLSRLDFRQVWDKFMLTFLKKLDEHKPIIFCWDLNVAHQPIDLKYPKANEWKHWYTIQEREWFSNYLKAWFIDTFRYLYPDKIQYSWWSMRANARKNNSWWRIDYCLISPKLKDKLVDAFIHDHILWSDHAPVGVILDI
jgi:exodeoxyribonuclease-3